MKTNLVEKLYREKNLPDEELKFLIEDEEYQNALFKKADSVRKEIYGTDVYIRGLIEVSNYCKNNCYYCGIRKDNKEAERYRLSKEEILTCCKNGYEAGFRTFVLQGGEDAAFTKEAVCEIIREIKKNYGDCAVTLSLGERPYGDYKAWFDTGADRYLLRHETADDEHYRLLHPAELSLEERKKCLRNLKEIGYQTGSGFMIDSPYQTTDLLIKDIRFLQELKPDMIGIGPYISHKNTPFHNFQSGGLYKCLRLISIMRLLFPYSLIPATTALGTIDPIGRELGIAAGANVVMPNLSPVKYRKKYTLYDNKLHTDEEAAENKRKLEVKINSAGYRIVTDIGHVKKE